MNTGRKKSQKQRKLQRYQNSVLELLLMTPSIQDIYGAGGDIYGADGDDYQYKGY